MIPKVKGHNLVNCRISDLASGLFDSEPNAFSSTVRSSKENCLEFREENFKMFHRCHGLLESPLSGNFRGLTSSA